MVAAHNSPDGEPIEATPRRLRVRRPTKPATRLRNDYWLAIQREFSFSQEQTARFVDEPASTVREGLREAREREQAPAPAPDSALSADEIAYLCETYGPGTPLGDDLRVRDFLSRHRSTPPAR